MVLRMQTGKSNIVNARLLEARKIKGVTAKAVAKEIGVTAQALSLYEQNLCKPGEEVFNKLVDLYNLPFDFYFKPQKEIKVESPVFYRKFTRATKANRETAFTESIWFVNDVFEELISQVKFPKVDNYFFDIKNSISIEKRAFDFEIMAKLIRRQWKLGNGPIENFTFELEKRGVIIAKLDLDDDIDGFSYWSNGRPFMFVNENNNYFRLRMSMAHELCHLFFHDAEDIEHDLKRVETEAKNFAGALLLQERSFVEDVGAVTLQDLLYLKPKWRVSVQGMLKRCEQLGLINDDRLLSLNKQISIKRWRKVEPYDNMYEPEKPILLKQAISLLLEKNIFSKSELRRKFGLDTAFVEKACCLDADTLKDNNTIILDFMKKNN